MLCSDYCLTPKGGTPTSSRFFSAIACGCVPLVISDDLAYHLPFLRQVNYSFVQYVRHRLPRRSIGRRARPHRRTRATTAGLRPVRAPRPTCCMRRTARVADNMLHEYAATCGCKASVASGTIGASHPQLNCTSSPHPRTSSTAAGGHSRWHRRRRRGGTPACKETGPQERRLRVPAVPRQPAKTSSD